MALITYYLIINSVVTSVCTCRNACRPICSVKTILHRTTCCSTSCNQFLCLSSVKKTYFGSWSGKSRNRTFDGNSTY